ncbi:MAG: LysR family transcriptional regulator [Roseburia sp.]|nr:LysR family transcriptional regulator [Roseburia sp.]
MTGNLEYYKVFYYVARSGSVTKAAGELTLSQPAVSQALKQLERSLGVDLFYRAARGVKLTGAGELLFRYVARGYEQIAAGEEQVRQLLNLELGEIRIGASDMTLKYYLLPYLERFHEAYSEIKVNVTNAPTPETLQFLREGRIDFGIVSSPFEADKDMDVRSVREIEDVFVAGRRFTAYKNKTLDLQVLESLPMIVLEGSTSTRSYMDDYLAGNHVFLQPEFELATSDMIVQFALRNLGVGCVVRDFAREYLDSGQLFELRFNKMIPRRSFCVVRNRRIPSSMAAVKLLEIMELT